MILGGVWSDDRWNGLDLDDDVHRWICVCVYVVFLRLGAWLLCLFVLLVCAKWSVNVKGPQIDKDNMRFFIQLSNL